MRGFIDTLKITAASWLFGIHQNIDVLALAAFIVFLYSNAFGIDTKWPLMAVATCFVCHSAIQYYKVLSSHLKYLDFILEYSPSYDKDGEYGLLTVYQGHDVDALYPKSTFDDYSEAEKYLVYLNHEYQKNVTNLTKIREPLGFNIWLPYYKHLKMQIVSHLFKCFERNFDQSKMSINWDSPYAKNLCFTLIAMLNSYNGHEKARESSYYSFFEHYVRGSGADFLPLKVFGVSADDYDWSLNRKINQLLSTSLPSGPLANTLYDTDFQHLHTSQDSHQ